MSRRRAMHTPPAALTALLSTFATRRDAQYVATPDGAMNNCDTLARRFAAVCRRAGLAATVLELSGCLGHYPDAHPRWQRRAARLLRRAESLDGVSHAHRVRHYVTAVTLPDEARPWLVDWTFRQFLPTAPWPLVTPRPEAHAVLPADPQEAPRGQAHWRVIGTATFSVVDDLALWSARLRRRRPRAGVPAATAPC